MEVDFNNMLKKSSFIITRFNLKLFSKDKNNKTTLTDQWLKERFELFETYCFPSVEGQVCKHFIGFVFLLMIPKNNLSKEL